MYNLISRMPYWNIGERKTHNIYLDTVLGQT